MSTNTHKKLNAQGNIITAKEFRRSQAEERNARYNAMSSMEKLAQIAQRPGASKREKDRIMLRVAFGTLAKAA